MDALHHKMGRMTKLTSLNLLLFLFAGICVNAQGDYQDTEKKEIKVQKYTVMERFEPEYVIPVDERKRLKIERREMICTQKKYTGYFEYPRSQKVALASRIEQESFFR